MLVCVYVCVRAWMCMLVGVLQNKKGKHVLSVPFVQIHLKMKQSAIPSKWPVCALCVCMCVCVRARMCVVGLWLDTKQGCCEFCSISFHLIPLRQGLSLNLKQGWWDH